MPRKCINHPNTLCHVCGSFIANAQRHTVTPDLQKLYQLHLGSPFGDKVKELAPNVVLDHVKWIT
jgi:hypothetical protein